MKLTKVDVGCYLCWWYLGCVSHGFSGQVCLHLRYSSGLNSIMAVSPYPISDEYMSSDLFQTWNIHNIFPRHPRRRLPFRSLHKHNILPTHETHPQRPRLEHLRPRYPICHRHLHFPVRRHHRRHRNTLFHGPFLWCNGRRRWGLPSFDSGVLLRCRKYFYKCYFWMFTRYGVY